MPRWPGASAQAVGKWRRRFLAAGVPGLRDEPRPGRPRTYDDERVAQVIYRALQEKPAGATRWSTRSMGAAAGVSHSTVQRWFSLFGVKPHQAGTFKLPSDPTFIEKVLDVTGIYLNPPDHAIALCVDGKSRNQALERSQPTLPMGPGCVEGYTRDFIRYGTATLVPALDVATGKVIAKRKKRHRRQDFLAFLQVVDCEVPKDLDIHLVLDNYATREHAKVEEWVAARERCHLHCTPTYSSWLNQVERWFGLPSERGSFRNVTELASRIHAFTEGYDAGAKPFVWVATAQSIIDKVERIPTRISSTPH